MSAVWRALRAEPVATMAVVTAAVGLAVVLGGPAKLMGGVEVLIGAVLAFPVRSGVVPAGKVAGAVADAASQAAQTAVREVGADTAGGVGEVTSTGLHVVGQAAQAATSRVLGAIGISGRRP
jgi:hypothetical protein